MMHFIGLLRELIECPRCTHQDDSIYMDIIEVIELPNVFIVELKCFCCTRTYHVKISCPFLVMK